MRARRSYYLPGAAYRPSKKKLARRQREVLEVLRGVGSKGITRPEAPEYLLLGWSARVSELRRAGYRIDSVPEKVGDVTLARYVLVSEPRNNGTANGPAVET